VWLGNGDGSLRDPRAYRAGQEPDDFTVEDVDRDGRPDLVVVDSGHSTLLILRGRAQTDVPIGVSDLDASVQDGIVQLTWSLSGDVVSSPTRIFVQRAPAPDGPFVDVSTTPLRPSASMRFIDSTVLDGEKYWYRLLLDDGSNRSPSAPIGGIMIPSLPEDELDRVSDTSSGAPLWIGYRLSRPRSRIALIVYDARGREVWSVDRGFTSGGRYREPWHRQDRFGHRVGRGVYFVTLRTESGIARVRRFVLLH
jgi:hypothetical protein